MSKSLTKSLNSLETKKEKVLGLYEDGIIAKADLMSRLSSLNDEKDLLEQRITPIEQQLKQDGVITVSYTMVQKVMKSFEEAYKKALTSEQRKRLLHLLINKITISENRKIDTIQIQLNKEVLNHFMNKGEGNSSNNGEFPSPFTIYINL